MSSAAFHIRPAQPQDAGEIALAHRDSICSLGLAFYPPGVVDDWQEGLAPEVYLRAMENGEVFFIATGTIDGKPSVLGFSSDYRIDGTVHGTSVYVRGMAARRGIGTALLEMAEAHAIANGATSINIEASLAGVEFYRANGYAELTRGETHLMSGKPIGCVYMQKVLASGAPRA